MISIVYHTITLGTLGSAYLTDLIEEAKGKIPEEVLPALSVTLKSDSLYGGVSSVRAELGLIIDKPQHATLIADLNKSKEYEELVIYNNRGHIFLLNLDRISTGTEYDTALDNYLKRKGYRLDRQADPAEIVDWTPPQPA